MKIHLKEWDSAFFQIKIGEIFIENPEQTPELEDSGFDMILANSDKEIILNIAGYENSYNGSLVYFEKNIKSFTKNDVTNIKTIKEGDSFNKKELFDIAFESGKFSRFKSDKNFDHQAFKNLYMKWVENSLNSTIADEVIVFKDKRGILGFITYKIQNGSCYIGLLGIKPGEQGKGIGRKLLAAVENRIFYRDVKHIKVKTQQVNLPALLFYETMGFKEEHKNFIKHYWKK